jgi:hypothetical protein
MDSSGHLAMTATIVQDRAKSVDSPTLLAQTGNGVTVSERFTQTKQQIKTFEASTQTDDWQETTIIFAKVSIYAIR